MIGRFARWLGYAPARELRELRNKVALSRQLLARFDAASQSPETRRHWAASDSLAADAAASPAVRAIVRSRARYERFNNPYLCGQLRTLANDVVGVGPALQLITANEAVNEAVEDKFNEWADVVGLAAKLRMMREVRAGDGEVFGRLSANRRLACPVKLDLELIEGDQCATPSLRPGQADVDGIELDAMGNPIFYYFLARHPGDTGGYSSSEYIRVPASQVIHYFRVERPGQHRGIPEIISSLNLHATRRSLRQSVVTAARAVSMLGAVLLESEAEPDSDEVLEPFTTLDIEHGQMTVAPFGTKATQIRPEQPSTTYGEMDDRLINEQARPLNMPFNVAAANSSKYNYASGRLDHQTYDRSVRIDQREMELIILRPLIQAWAVEATRIAGYLPGRAGQVYLPTLRDPDWPVPCTWIWSERDHVDPQKEANATETRVRGFMMSRAEDYAKRRRDWRNEIDQVGRERIALDDAGLLTLDAQLAPRVLEVLKAASLLGADTVVEVLSLLGVPRAKAESMAERAVRVHVPQVTTEPPGGELPSEAVSGNGGRGRVSNAIP